MDVAIPMKHLGDMPVHLLAGCPLGDLQSKALRPYHPEAIAFLTAWSKRLFTRADIRSYPDIASFAYWCRPANLSRLERQLGSDGYRLGRGVALHIAPANVPVNFAYSFAFGLLAGNANIVRVPESLPIQSKILCAVAKELLALPDHALIASMTTLLSYPREDAVTEQLSASVDVRFLWGGDQTIKHLRQMPTMPRCFDIAFADRYSLCVMSSGAVLAADSKTLNALTHNFYNDVFLLDQNACSSPHLVIWKGESADVASAKARFWNALIDLLRVTRESLGVHAVEKYTHLCRVAMMTKGAQAVARADNHVFRVDVDELPENISELRGRYGFFVETVDNDLTKLRRVVNERYQTLTYFGVDPDVLAKMVVTSGLFGIDRIVPVGKALDIGIVWDGYDLVRATSRVVAVE